MKTYSATTQARLDAGEVDQIDAVVFFFDGGTIALFKGVGSFPWDSITYRGAGALLSIEAPPSTASAEAQAIVLRLRETYVPEGSDTEVNIFDNGVRATIDQEDWRWRVAILSTFWRDKDGAVLEREQVGIRLIDDLHREVDEQGRPTLVVVLEEPDIAQRAIEGKTANAELQALIDATDKGMEHVGTTVDQPVNWGRSADKDKGKR